MPFPWESYAGHIHKLHNTCHFLHSAASVLLRHMKNMHEDKNCSKRECHSVSSSGTGIFFFCTFDNTEQRPQRSETCLGPHMKPAAELATHSVLQSFNHYPNHMVVLALSGDFPPPVPHVPKEDTHKIDLASAKVLISLFLWALKLWSGSLFSLTYKKLFERGKKLQWGFFSPLSWHHAEDLLHLFAMTK